MAGPNSAPNGDGRLVKGSKYEEEIFIKELNKWISLRDYLSSTNRLRTGKTR